MTVPYFGPSPAPLARLQHRVDRHGGAQGGDGIHQTAFTMIVDLRGYEVRDIAAHKEMRTVIPLTLADYGFRTALLDLFDPVDLPLRPARGSICIAVAHVHHDADKMTLYDDRLGRENERFFTDYATADAWLQAIT